MSTTNRSPAFRFYAKDWRDVKVRRMSLAAQGAYMAILADMWVDSKDQSSLLDCNPFIAKSLGVSLEEWMQLRGEIQHADEPLLIEKSGRLFSQRLRYEAVKQRKYADSQAERAHKRWDATAMPRHSKVSTEPHAESCSSSSSSLSSSKKNKKKSERLPMPEHWALNVEMAAYATMKGMTPETMTIEFAKCTLHHEKIGSRFTQAGWEGKTWQSWVLNWITYGAKQVPARAIQPSQTQCAYANSPCEADAVPGSKYCQPHRDLFKRSKPGSSTVQDVDKLVSGLSQKKSMVICS